MKNFIVIDYDYFHKYSILNNLENDKKCSINCGKIMTIFFNFIHSKRSAIINHMEKQ